MYPYLFFLSNHYSSLNFKLENSTFLSFKNIIIFMLYLPILIFNSFPAILSFMPQRFHNIDTFSQLFISMVSMVIEKNVEHTEVQAILGAIIFCEYDQKCLSWLATKKYNTGRERVNCALFIIRFSFTSSNAQLFHLFIRTNNLKPDL